MFRSILSFFSRSELRSVIKPALRGNLRDKIPVMKMIDFTSIKDFNQKRESVSDIFKIISFQYSQIFSLVDGFEKDSYTKNGLISHYPDLSRMLRREELLEDDFITLNKYRDRLIHLAESRIDKMITLVE